MDTSGGIQASLSGRYARALFDLALAEKALAAVGKSLDVLGAALTESQDLRRVTTNPMIGRKDAGNAIDAVAQTLKLDSLSRNFLGVLATNSRLAELGAIIATFKALAARHRGEVTAYVTTAHPLDAAQSRALSARLAAREGHAVAIEASTNPDILGGLIVKIGSQMIDNSIATKLNTLAIAMKG